MKARTGSGHGHSSDQEPLPCLLKRAPRLWSICRLSCAGEEDVQDTFNLRDSIIDRIRTEALPIKQRVKIPTKRRDGEGLFRRKVINEPEY